MLPENMKWIKEDEEFAEKTAKSDTDNVADYNPIYR